MSDAQQLPAVRTRQGGSGSLHTFNCTSDPGNEVAGEQDPETYSAIAAYSDWADLALRA